MSSELFRTFMHKRKLAFIQKQAPPGPPPRRGLKWKPSTHRWIREDSDPNRPTTEFYHPEGAERWETIGQELKIAIHANLSTPELAREDARLIKERHALNQKIANVRKRIHTDYLNPQNEDVVALNDLEVQQGELKDQHRMFTRELDHRKKHNIPDKRSGQKIASTGEVIPPFESVFSSKEAFIKGRITGTITDKVRDRLRKPAEFGSQPTTQREWRDLISDTYQDIFDDDNEVTDEELDWASTSRSEISLALNSLAEQFYTKYAKTGTRR